MNIMDALHEVSSTLEGIGGEPALIKIDGHSSVNLPTVQLTFKTSADLARFAAAERAKVSQVNKSHLGHIEYSAIYDRPSRRMLLIHYCFTHCPDRGESHE